MAKKLVRFTPEKDGGDMCLWRPTTILVERVDHTKELMEALVGKTLRHREYDLPVGSVLVIVNSPGCNNSAWGCDVMADCCVLQEDGTLLQVGESYDFYTKVLSFRDHVADVLAEQTAQLA